jgi:hypothetical protein
VDDGWRPTEAEVESVGAQLLEVLGYLVGRCRLPVSKPVSKVPMVSALEAIL